MKKILSLLLAAVLITSALVIPTAVVANGESEFTSALGSHFKFTAENIYKDYGTVNSGKEITFKGNKFFPYFGADGTDGAGFSIVNPGGDTNLFRVESGANYTMFVPLDEQGRPFEVQPGHAYTVKIKAYNPRSFNWNQASVNVINVNTNSTEGFSTSGNGGSIALGSAATFASGTSTRLENVIPDTGEHWPNVIVPGGNNKNTFIADNIDGYITEYNTTGKIEGWTQPTAGAGYTDNTSFSLSNITTDFSNGMIAAPKNGQYVSTFKGELNAEGAIEFTIPYTLGGRYSATAENCTQTVKGNNYLCLNLSGSKTTLDGEEMFTTVDFEYIEIFDTVCSYTFVGENGEVLKTGEYIAGDTVKSFIPAAPRGKYFVGWYTDSTFSVLAKVDEKATPGFTTYYAKFADYSRGVTSFYGADSVYWKGVRLLGLNASLSKVAYAYTDGDYHIGVPNKTWLSAEKGEDYTYIYNHNNGKTKNCNLPNCNVYNCEHSAANPHTDENGITYRRAWASGMSVFAVNRDGSLFAARPNTTYRVTVRYDVPGTVPLNKDLVGVSPKQYAGEENGRGDAEISIGAGFNYSKLTDNANSSDGGLQSECFDKKNASVSIADSTGGITTLTEIITTGEFDNQIPAIGLFIELNANCWKLNAEGTDYELDRDKSGAIKLYSLTVEEVGAIEDGGISVLTPEALETAGAQAMRVYYSYALNNEGKVIYSGKTYSLVARGILYSVKADRSDMLLESVNTDKAVFKAEKREEFDKCWMTSVNGNQTTVVYSNYIKDIAEKDYSTPVTFRGYLVLSDGESEIIVYSDNVISQSVDSLT